MATTLLFSYLTNGRFSRKQHPEFPQFCHRPATKVGMDGGGFGPESLAVFTSELVAVLGPEQMADFTGIRSI